MAEGARTAVDCSQAPDVDSRLIRSYSFHALVTRTFLCIRLRQACKKTSQLFGMQCYLLCCKLGLHSPSISDPSLIIMLV